MNRIVPITNPTTMQIYYPSVFWTTKPIPDEDSWDTVLDYGHKDFFMPLKKVVLILHTRSGKILQNKLRR